MKRDEVHSKAGVMEKKIPIAILALLAGALMLPDHVAFAQVGGAAEVITSDGFQAGRSGGAVCSLRSAGANEWIRLHRPDGGVVHIRADQVVFVTSAAGTGADKRAQSKIQLLNGFSDVRESVEEVMQVIRNATSDQISKL
jgi:hypothetical protein